LCLKSRVHESFWNSLLTSVDLFLLQAHGKSPLIFGTASYCEINGCLHKNLRKIIFSYLVFSSNFSLISFKESWAKSCNVLQFRSSSTESPSFPPKPRSFVTFRFLNRLNEKEWKFQIFVLRNFYFTYLNNVSTLSKGRIVCLFGLWIPHANFPIVLLWAIPAEHL